MEAAKCDKTVKKYADEGFLCLDAQSEKSRVQLDFYNNNTVYGCLACNCDDAGSPTGFPCFYLISQANMELYLSGKEFEYELNNKKFKTAPGEFNTKVSDFQKLSATLEKYLKTEEFKEDCKRFKLGFKISKN
ncbi:Uncharacterised protein [Candidatus Tiddalikarchaeum anstoanum]|nr:Uncharacterised protein [Candidatus Tiddalikarchaeum anstoanum]